MRVDEHTIELAGSPVFFRAASTEEGSEAGDRPGDAPAGPPTNRPIVYLHGVPTSSDDWLPLLERTGGLAPDLIGFGRSGKGGQLDYSLDGYVEFLVELLAQLNIAPPLTLVGHGWGGAIAAALAQREAAVATKLVLIDPVPLGLDGFTWPRVIRLLRRPALGELVMGSTTRRVLARTLRSGAVNDRAWPQARLDGVWDQFDQGTQRAILRLHRFATEASLNAAGDGLDAVAAPTFVLWGACDPWLPAQLAENYARRFRDAQVEVVDGAGHWLWLDEPAVIERLTRLLDAS